MDSFDLEYDDDCEDADLHCPPPVIDGCTCPCHRLKPSLAERVVGYLMLAGVAALCIWILHILACQ